MLSFLLRIKTCVAHLILGSEGNSESVKVVSDLKCKLKIAY